MSIEAIVNEFSAVAANPKGQLKAYKDAGKKCIGVMPYYAPEELVYAAGMMPFGMWGSNNKTEQRSKEYCATFYCTIAQLDLEMLLDGTHLINHVGAPLLSLYSFLCLETEPRQKLPKWAPLCAVATTIVYAIPVLILNIAKLYVGPYPFLHVYEQPVYMSVFWILAILGGNVVIARLVQMVYNRCIK